MKLALIEDLVEVKFNSHFQVRVPPKRRVRHALVLEPAEANRRD